MYLIVKISRAVPRYAPSVGKAAERFYKDKYSEKFTRAEVLFRGGSFKNVMDFIRLCADRPPGACGGAGGFRVPGWADSPPAIERVRRTVDRTKCPLMLLYNERVSAAGGEREEFFYILNGYRDMSVFYNGEIIHPELRPILAGMLKGVLYDPSMNPAQGASIH